MIGSMIGSKELVNRLAPAYLKNIQLQRLIVCVCVRETEV